MGGVKGDFCVVSFVSGLDVRDVIEGYYIGNYAFFLGYFILILF